MSTAPWSPDAPAALRESLFHVATVDLIPPAGDPVTLEVERGEVVFDEGWSPHVRADLVCRVPDTQAALDLMDPRVGTRAVVYAGYRFPGGRTDVHVLADLALRSRPVGRPANTVAIAAVSAECRVMDADPMGASRSYGAVMLVRAAIKDLVEWLTDGVTVQVTATSTMTLGATLTVETGHNVWNAAQELTDRIDAWLYVDGAGQWHLTDRPSTAGLSAYVMATGPAGNVSRSDSGLDVTEWGNAVLLQLPAGFAYAYASTGPFATSAVPAKVVKVKRDDDTGGPTAHFAAARAILRRVLSRGRGFTLTGPAAYWLRPGHTVTARLPLGPQERHLVSRVVFDLAAGSMTVKTRVPDDDTTITTGA